MNGPSSESVTIPAGSSLLGEDILSSTRSDCTDQPTLLPPVQLEENNKTRLCQHLSWPTVAVV